LSSSAANAALASGRHHVRHCVREGINAGEVEAYLDELTATIQRYVGVDIVAALAAERNRCLAS
jgi:hypothetical protein